MADEEWYRKSKGGFTRMVVSPNRDQFADIFVEFLLFSVQCFSRKRAPLFWGKPGVQAVCMQLTVGSTFILSGALGLACYS